MLIFLLLATMFTANDLKQYCASTVASDQSYCLGYLLGYDQGAAYTALVASGALDREVGTAGAEHTYQRITGCSSDGVTMGQVKLIFLKYVDEHPEELHLPASFILSKSLVAAFPCRQ